ncbi:MAG: hypothetical protein GF383_11380 [Candidatus Lokiarchaeota archaeon]|nr:hypothetical protein [Candidatus Lokiarchaeota archaeon]MBD3341316.1 hypothetical protein [Candidatus Lokiarchaeota archaeon]
MIKEIEKNNTLIVKGPTRVNLLEGKIDVLGKKIEPEESKEVKKDTKDFLVDDESVLIVPSGNTYPLFTLEKSKLEIFTSTEDENLFLIDENSIVDEWIEIKDELIETINKGEVSPLKIMVLGISCGKTTFCKYLANNFLDQGFKGAYLDSDLGQQMFFTTTLNIGRVENPLLTNDDVESEFMAFVGSTYPKGNLKFIVSQSSKDLIDEYLDDNNDTDYILIDTDGWIKSEAGIIYKKFFIKTVNPDVLVIFYDEEIEELEQIEEMAKLRKDRIIYRIEEKNTYYYEKSKEERRWLRQSIISKRFEDFMKISIPLDDIKFIKKDYDVEADEVIEKEIPVEELIKLPYHYVIIAMLDENSDLINIGLLFTINIEKNYILIFSDLNYKEQMRIKKIALGSLRLSTKGNHQGYLYL